MTQQVRSNCCNGQRKLAIVQHGARKLLKVSHKVLLVLATEMKKRNGEVLSYLQFSKRRGVHTNLDFVTDTQVSA